MVVVVVLLVVLLLELELELVEVFGGADWCRMTERDARAGASTASASTSTTAAEDGLESVDLSQYLTDEDRFERPACWDIFAKWRFCTTPSHQIKNYYIYGEVDPCLWQWEDLKLCLKLKLERPEAAARKWEARQQEKLQNETPLVSAVGTVWEARTEPPKPTLPRTHEQYSAPKEGKHDVDAI
ncbi:uncharacterized protein MONBRDRAFT_12141 [Monosiga brevicollis MX1]|uniref:Uncharacterized protein n=1 Tax=Monosiga brevicollis TaxID=81824 RepID=A9VBC4_MONBE|nr:uncharacterized protein MONBRDRAFT_12141 [Monosiga brevicollis MX1]EDQ85164.1 predicted protein [Monosiga brevicollis MX1]|eukprot:XP_001749989.1 hypothetical protein [Monosiga brevicollis MX1]